MKLRAARKPISRNCTCGWSNGRRRRRPTKLFTEGPADVSPDGRWLAYQESDGFSRAEIYVSPFPDVSGKRIFVAPGTLPVWARRTRSPELYYIAPSGALTSVSIPTLELGAGEVKELFSTNSYFRASQGRSHDVSADGKRFLFIKDPPANAERGSIVVVLHWTEELRARLSRT